MGFADLEHGKSSSAGISALAAGDNHLFLLAADVINLGPHFQIQKLARQSHNLQRTGKPHWDK